MHHKFKTGLIAASIVSFSFAASAGPIEERQEKMKTVGKSIGIVAKMAKGQAEFDSEAALQAFVDMKGAAEGFKELFPDGTGEGDTEASPAIYSDRDGFDVKAESFLETIGKYTSEAPADLSVLQASVGEVGRECGTCHKLYRIKKN